MDFCKSYRELKTVTPTLILMLSLLATAAWAQKKHHHAHDHGVAKLAIASDGLVVSIDLETPAEGLYGFEYEPKTEVDQKIVNNANLRLTDHAAEIFRFAPELGCKVTKAEVVKPTNQNSKKPAQSDAHRDIDARVAFTCIKPVAGTKVTVTLIKEFPRMKTIRVQITTDKTQKADTIKKPEQEVSL